MTALRWPFFKFFLTAILLSGGSFASEPKTPAKPIPCKAPTLPNTVSGKKGSMKEVNRMREHFLQYQKANAKYRDCLAPLRASAKKTFDASKAELDILIKAHNDAVKAENEIGDKVNAEISDYAGKSHYKKRKNDAKKSNRITQ